MATAYQLEPARSGSSLHALNNDPMGSLGAVGDSTMTTDSHIRTAPPPNPTFTFPARPEDVLSSPPPPPASDSAPRRRARRPMSAIEPTTESYQLTAEASDDKSAGRIALPAFSFNPGAALPPGPNESSLDDLLPSSPQLPRTLPQGPRPGHGHGHRRGGSEFVGGRLREGNSIAVMTGTPTKQDLLGAGTPSLVPPRRGHRRGNSSALSTNDLSLLSPPFLDFSMKGSSAPNSPTNFESVQPLSLIVPDPPAEPAKPEPEPVADVEVEEKSDAVIDTVPPEEPERPTTPEAKPVSKARVGFSDTLEFIPRPLSLVSIDTSSTVTARPGHTLSGSISSLVSASSPEHHRGTGSPSISRSPSRNTNDSRPSTAGAILDRIPQQPKMEINTSPRRRNSIPALLDLSEATAIEPSTPSPSKTSKRWSFFNLDSFSTHTASPTKARPHSASSGDSVVRVAPGGSTSDHDSESTAEPMESNKASKTNKEKKTRRKRRKKVKGWAGSILPRKPKSQGEKPSKYEIRPPTPPSSVLPPDEDEDEDEGPPTLDTTIFTRDIPPTPPQGSSPRREDISSPMIDLDAALGPFNTPLPHNPEWEAAQRAAGNTGKRLLHSAQGMRGFTGPGMHYHRRAESAPDLPPFDATRSGIHRFGSSSTMADVFEEDEEDDSEDADDSQQSRSGASLHMSEDSSGEITPPAIVHSDPVQDAAVSVRRRSSGLSDKEQSVANSVRSQRSKASLHDSPIVEEPAMSVRFSTPINTPHSEASESPRLPSRGTPGRELAPFELGAPQAPYTGVSAVSPHSLNFPSSVPRSPVSIDTQRLSTAPSSVHEENSFQSLLMGEPGPEVRLSVDYDIPSLTSSNSTTTRESCFVPQSRMSQPSLRQPRPLSVSSTTFGRRRSSLASLSRLISSSHGEKSKLSMEVTLDNETEKKKSKSSRGKRLSKLMQFWKPNKESATSANRH